MRYGVSVVSNLENIDHVITTLPCICIVLAHCFSLHRIFNDLNPKCTYLIAICYIHQIVGNSGLCFDWLRIWQSGHITLAAIIGVYRQTSNISHTLVGKKIVDQLDVVGASPAGATPTTSSFSTEQLASMVCLGKDNCKTRRERFKLFGFGVTYIRGLTVYLGALFFSQVTTNHLKVWQPWVSAMAAWLSNELQRLAC